MRPEHTTIGALIEQYEVLLLDAYGVLVDETCALPGACELIERIRARGRNYFVVTNGSARSVADTARAYQKLGVPIDAARVINSGSVLPAYFRDSGLAGQATAVLGTTGSRALAEAAGAHVVDALAGEDFAVLIVANQGDYPFVSALDAVISTLFARIDRGTSTHMILTNPDIIYPQGPRRFGITAGAVALTIEAALAARYGADVPMKFVRLGKPHAPIFAEARRRAGTDSLVMVGDQLATDIDGALSSGIAAALLTTGVSQWREGAWAPPPGIPGRAPAFYLIDSICPE